MTSLPATVLAIFVAVAGTSAQAWSQPVAVPAEPAPSPAGPEPAAPPAMVTDGAAATPGAPAPPPVVSPPVPAPWVLAAPAATREVPARDRSSPSIFRSRTFWIITGAVLVATGITLYAVTRDDDICGGCGRVDFRKP